MPPWAAFEWERTGWTLETIPTETPCSAAARAARWPASPAPMTSTSWDGTGPDGMGHKPVFAVGIRHLGRERGGDAPRAPGRLPWTHVRGPSDHAFPRPRDPHRGRLVVVPDPVPGHLLDVAVLRRPPGAVGELEPGVPSRRTDRGGLLRLDPAARARARRRRPPQRDRDPLDPTLDLRRHGADGPRGRLARDRSEGRARRAGGDADDLRRLRGAGDPPRQLDRVPRGGDLRIAGRRPGGPGDVRLARLDQPAAAPLQPDPGLPDGRRPGRPGDRLAADRGPQRGDPLRRRPRPRPRLGGRRRRGLHGPQP